MTTPTRTPLAVVGTTKGQDKSGNTSAASRRQIEAAEKQRQAVALRHHGATFQQIADQLGYTNPSAARKAFLKALERWGVEDVTDLRAAEVARLDSYLLVVATKVKAGELKAVETALKISERRAKLLGLDQPTKVVITEDLLEAERDKLRERVATLRVVGGASSSAP
jgi:hypothetical protein